MNCNIYYRKCPVPECKNSSVKTPQKLWIQVPNDLKRRNTWLKLARRDPKSLSTKSRLYFCEDHFDLKNDMNNYTQYKIMGSVKQMRMIPNCVPSRFDCQADRKYKSTPSEPRDAFNKRERMSLIKEIEENIVKDNYVQISSPSCGQDFLPPDNDTVMINCDDKPVQVVQAQIHKAIQASHENILKLNPTIQSRLSASPMQIIALNNIKNSVDSPLIKEELITSEEDFFVKKECATNEEFVLKDEIVTSEEEFVVKDEFTEEEPVVTAVDQPMEYLTESSLSESINHEDKRVGQKETSKCYFKRHLYTHKQEKPHLTEHMRTHTGERPYACIVCDKSFYTKCDLTRHMRTHTGGRPYSCNVCNKNYSYNSQLAAHMRTHTGERPYACDVCDKSFSYKFQLTIHRRIHTGERPYACDVCVKSYYCKSRLAVHMRTHTGERPYACNVCDKSYYTKGHLTEHNMRAHIRERPYTCDVCDKSFSSKSNLNSHIRTHTKERPYACNVCDKNYSCKSRLAVHMRTHTGEWP